MDAILHEECKVIKIETLPEHNCELYVLQYCGARSVEIINTYGKEYRVHPGDMTVDFKHIEGQYSKQHSFGFKTRSLKAIDKRIKQMTQCLNEGLKIYKHE